MKIFNDECYPDYSIYQCMYVCSYMYPLVDVIATLYSYIVTIV